DGLGAVALQAASCTDWHPRVAAISSRGDRKHLPFARAAPRHTSSGRTTTVLPRAAPGADSRLDAAFLSIEFFCLRPVAAVRERGNAPQSASSGARSRATGSTRTRPPVTVPERGPTPSTALVPSSPRSSAPPGYSSG